MEPAIASCEKLAGYRALLKRNFQLGARGKFLLRRAIFLAAPQQKA
jgi:hypothetical protein